MSNRPDLTSAWKGVTSLLAWKGIPVRTHASTMKAFTAMILGTASYDSIRLR